MNQTTELDFGRAQNQATTTTGGVVASPHWRASEIGAQVMSTGGNAVDAALAAGFALGVLEPWMSGVGGGGVLLVYGADDETVSAIDFGVVSPRKLNIADYPLTGADTGHVLFGWPKIVDDRNLKGYASISVPGYVAGAASALKTLGTLKWAEILAPAVDLAEQGLEVDWYASLWIAGSAADLRGDRVAEQLFLRDALPPIQQPGQPKPRLANKPLARTLRRLVDNGPEDFYFGEIGASILSDLHMGGSQIEQADFQNYEVLSSLPLASDYRRSKIYAAPGLYGGATLLRALDILNNEDLNGEGEPDPLSYAAYAEALSSAFAYRFANEGHAGGAAAQSCTAHISAVDRHGNLAALTQTILSPFGAKVALPGTGILMNNGLVSFDPRTGRPNSLAAGVRGLSNMCPTLVVGDDGRRFALGGAGGRFIVPAIAQIISFCIDYGIEPVGALHVPRIDLVELGSVLADDRLGHDVFGKLEKTFIVSSAADDVYPTAFSRPNIVMKDLASSKSAGAAHPNSPWAGVSVSL